MSQPPDPPVNQSARIILNWPAIACVAGLIGTTLTAVISGAFYIAPLRKIPEKMEAMQEKSEQGTLNTEKTMVKLESTLSNLSVNVADLNDSVKDARILRSEFNVFRDHVKEELERLKVQH